MSRIQQSSMHTTKSFRSMSVTGTAQNMMSVQTSTTSLRTSSSSAQSTTSSVETSEDSSKGAAVPAMQKLYLLLPNHKCPNKKNCPFHPPEEQEEELDQAEMTLVNKPRAMSLASHEDRKLLEEKLAKINEQISNNLIEGNKLHLPRKTSHDITIHASELDRLKRDHSPMSETPREESVGSDFDLDSGVPVDSCSDREMDEESLPLIKEEVAVPEIILTEELDLKKEDVQEEAAVQISEESHVDSGSFTYQPVSEPEKSEISTTVTMEEPVPEIHSKPLFVKELEYLTVTEGSLVRVECAVIGDPAPDIKWFKDNDRIDSNSHYKTEISDDGTVSLILERADMDDSGIYMCVAQNLAGKATTQSKIRVQKVVEETPIPIYPKPKDVEVEKYQLLAAPEFTAKLKNKMAPEGTTVHLTCSVTGIPEPSYRWFKDDREIYDGPNYTLKKHGGFLSLEIPCVKQSLAGKYTLEASNSEGTVSSSCQVEVEEEEDLETMELDFMRPKFITKIEDVRCCEGRDATFSCTATGKPMPIFKWQRDMINITPSDLVKLESDNKGNAHLTLRKVKPSDSGLYYCVAQSKAGRAKCSAYLLVRDTSSPLEITRKEPEFVRITPGKESSVERRLMLGEPPSLSLYLPDTLDVVVGGKLKLDCSVHGYPIPLVTWHKGDRELMYSQRHRIMLCGTLHTMEIPQVMALDKGDYIVRATNVHGTVQSACYVNILPKGSKIAPPDNRREALIEAAKENLQAPFFVKHLPKTIDTVNGMSVRLDCILHPGIELVQWSSSKSPHKEVDKAKKELADEGFHGEFIPSEAKPQEEPITRPRNKPVSQPQEKLMSKTHDEPVSRPQEEPVSRPRDEPVSRVQDEPQSKSEERKQSDKTFKKPDQEKRTELPSFLTTPKDMAQQKGSDVVIECTTSGYPEPEIKWYKDGKLITASSRITLTSANGKHTLKITDVRSADQGEYECKASNHGGTQTCAGKLTVIEDSSEPKLTKVEEKVVHEQKASPEKPVEEQPIRQESHEKPEKLPKPSFKQPLPKTTSAKHGDSVELACELTSSEFITVKWEVDGKELPNDARFHESSDASNNLHKLVIQSITEKDSAKYTCVVIMKDGDLIHSSTKLIVSAPKPKPVTKDKEVKPHFTSSLKDTLVKDGEALVLECDVEGNPRPQISWLRDGVEIFDSQDFQISSIGNHCKLQINEIYPEDEGTYSCKAVNNLGESLNSCYVSVEDVGGYASADSASTTSSKSYVFVNDQFRSLLPDGSHICLPKRTRVKRGEPAEGDIKKKTKKEQDELEVAPELVVKPRRQFIDVGGDAKFKASFDGSKNTVLFWSKDGKVLSSDNHFKMYEADGFHMLEVQKVTVEDNGMYSVTVQNTAGSDTAEAELEVFEKPKLLTRSGPTWEQALQDVTVEEGDEGVELVCISKELTKPSVKWFHNGKEIFSGFHIKLQHTSQTATLIIKEVQARDAGEFKCVMTGGNGEIESSCVLTIKAAEKMEPPMFVQELHDMEVEEGDKLELDVEVKGKSPIRIAWFHNNMEITNDSHHFILTSLGQVHTLTVPHATPESSGEYVCEAYNDCGDSDTFCFVQVKEVENPEPPDFVACPTNISAQEGETATIMCQVKGQPLPSVQWMRGGVVIATNEKYKITRIQDRHTLSVYNTDHTDAGEYICQLQNSEGTRLYACLLHIVDSELPQKAENTDLQKVRFDNVHEMQWTSRNPVTNIPIKVEISHQDSRNSDDGFQRNETVGPVGNNMKPTITTDIQQADRFADHIELSNVYQTSIPYDGSHNDRPKQHDITKRVKTTTVDDTYENVSSLNSRLGSNHSSNTVNFQPTVNKSHRITEENRQESGLTNFRGVLKNRQRSPNIQTEKSVSQNSQEYDFRAVLSHNKSKDPRGSKFVIETTNGSGVTSEVSNGQVFQKSKTAHATPSSLCSSSMAHENGEHYSVSTGDNIHSDTLHYSEVPPAIHDYCSMGKMQGGRENAKTRMNLSKHGSQVIVRNTDDIKGRQGNISFPDQNMSICNVSPAIDTQHRSHVHFLNDKNSSSLKPGSLKVDLSQLSSRKVNIIEYNPSDPGSEALKLEVMAVTVSIPMRSSIASPKLQPRLQSMSNPVQSSDLAVDSHAYEEQGDSDDVFSTMSNERKSAAQNSESRSTLQSFGSVFTWEKAPWDEKGNQDKIQSQNITRATASKTNGAPENQVKKNVITFAETLPRHHSEHEEVRRLDCSPPVTTRAKGKSVSGTSDHYLHSPMTPTNNMVDDFRNVKLKPAASKINLNSNELMKSKFMSKSTECIFRDVKLKPVSKSKDEWKHSEISSNAERIKASSKSFSNLVLSSPYHSSASVSPVIKPATTNNSAVKTATSYSLPKAVTTSNTMLKTATTNTPVLKTVATNSPTPRTVTSNPSTASRFSDSLKTFSSDTKPKSFQLHSRAQKSFQTNKVRASAGKFDKPALAGVSRSNSHKKSKGIGAKFEAAIKDSQIKTSKPSPIVSTHVLRNIQTVNSVSNDSQKTQHRITTEAVLSEKVQRRADAKSRSNDAVIDSGSNYHQDKVSDWINKRKSLQIGQTATFSSHEFTEPVNEDTVKINNNEKLSEISKGDKSVPPSNIIRESLATTIVATNAQPSSEEAEVKLVSRTTLTFPGVATNVEKATSSVLNPEVSVSSLSTREIKVLTSGNRGSVPIENHFEQSEAGTIQSGYFQKENTLTPVKRDISGTSHKSDPSNNQESPVIQSRLSGMKQKYQRHIQLYPNDDTEVSPNQRSPEIPVNISESAPLPKSTLSTSHDVTNTIPYTGYTRGAQRKSLDDQKALHVSENIIDHRTEQLNRMHDSGKQNNGFQNQAQEFSGISKDFNEIVSLNENTECKNQGGVSINNTSATTRQGLESGELKADKKQNPKSLVTQVSSEQKARASEVRRSRFRERLNKTHSTVDEGSNYVSKSSVMSPSDLAQTPSWRSLRLQIKGSNNVAPEVQISSTSTSALLAATVSATTSTVASTTQQQCPPSFPMPLRDVVVTYGSKAILLCQVIGNPRPVVKWLLNRKEIQSSDDVEIIYNEAVAQLTVKKTLIEHAGDYTCWAKNSLGTVSSHCMLSLQNGHDQITTGSNSSCLTIKEVTRSNPGNMSVCLNSSVGTNQASDSKFVEDVPDAPGGIPQVSDKASNSVFLSWHGPSSNTGGEVEFYVIEAKTQAEDAWGVIVAHCEELSCHIQGLRPGTCYQFRVLAANKHGHSPPSNPSDCVIIFDPQKSPNVYDSEDMLHIQPREVVINTTDKFEDHYEMDKEVGKGKFGVVYKCKQKSDGSTWAAKVVRCRTKDKEGLKREIDIMNKLRHPKLLLLWDAFETPRQMVLVMEYISAGELFERVIGEDYVLTENDCVNFVHQITEGVSYMHKCCILHLDLKPENILCVSENSNSIKIIDFGLAQFYTPGQSTKVLLGTPEFIAPEVINYDEINFATDMWSLGVICYVLLSGLSPFLGDSDAETLANVTQGDYDFDDEAFEEISDMAKDFISKLLVKNKDKRILTEQCLSHPWLNQDEVDNISGKRLNTERLKKFMLRRKWLKASNAVMAVSRLLKSNSQSILGSLGKSISSENLLDSPSSLSAPPIPEFDKVAELQYEEEEHNIPDPDFSSVDSALNESAFNENMDQASYIKENRLNYLEGKNSSNSKELDAASKSLLQNEATCGEDFIADSVSQLTTMDFESDYITDEIKNSVLNCSNQVQDFRVADPIPSQGESVGSSIVPGKSEEFSTKKQQINNRTENTHTPKMKNEGSTPQAPMFTKAMIRCKTYPGDVARFDVTVSGNPMPQVTWFFEDELVQKDSRHIISSNESSRSFSLIIRNIEEDDEGEYMCKAVNSHGETTCLAQLSVLEL